MSIKFDGKRVPARRWPAVLLTIAVAVAASTSACGDDSGDAEGEASSIKVGVFPNVTHAPGLVGVERNFLADALGEDIELEVQYFNAGGEAVEALFNGAIDLTFIGPNPAINGFTESGGDVRLIAGSTSGGAALVVREGIDSPEDLEGARLSSPALGNTQDVALRAWLADEGYETDPAGGGDVAISPLENPDILQAFRVGELDGAWVPEPWATRLIAEVGGHVLVDEGELWPDGRYVTTHVLADSSYFEDNPELIRSFLEGHLAALDFIQEDPEAAQETVLDAIEEISGTRLAADVIAAAWENLEFTSDPVAASLAESADDATAVGLLEPVDLTGIYDLTILNDLLGERGEEEVPGL